jgi:hypothetical protein
MNNISTTPIWKNPYRKQIVIISSILVFLSILYEFFSINGAVVEVKNGALLFHRICTDEIRLGDYIIYGGLVILPPLYFLIEYIHLFPDELKVKSDQLDDLKYTQELAAKLWAGLILAVTAFFWIRFGEWHG